MSYEITMPVVSMDATATAIEEQVALVRRGDLPAALKFWKEIKDEYEAMDKHRKRIYEALESLSRKTLPEMMEEANVKTITLADVGYRFTVAQKFSCSMPDKEGGMQWLRDNGLADLIQETVNAGTLSSAAKKRIEDDGLEMPEGLFKTSYMAYTSATKV